MAAEKQPSKWRRFRNRRVATPTVLQMEAVECGAAALAMILAAHGRWIPLEQLRVECGVSRDGSKASNMLKAARRLGLVAKGFRKDPDSLREMVLPMIIFWNFNHFVVLEGFRGKRVYLNDPAVGQRVVSVEEFDQSFTGVALTFERGPDFRRGGQSPSILRSLLPRFRGNQTALAYVVLAGLALVVPGLVIPTFTRFFIDSILVGGMEGWFRPLLVGMGLVALMQAGLTWLQQRYLLRFSSKLALASSSKFFWHLLRLPVEFFSQRSAGDLGSRVQLNDRVAELLSGKLATAVIESFSVVFFLFLMFQYDVTLTWISIAVVGVNVFGLRMAFKTRSEESQKLLMEQGKLMGKTMIGMMTIETLKASGREDDFFAGWSGSHAKVLNAQQQLGVASHLLNSVPPLLQQLNTIAILSLGGLRVMDGAMTLGMLVAYQSLMYSFVGPVTNLVALAGELQTLRGDMVRLDDVLRYPADPRFTRVEVRDVDGPPTETAKLTGQLELRNLTFGYSRLEQPFVQGFDLILPPGARVALTGASGSGKSTIAKLVGGLYEPWQGEILFDGSPRHDFPAARVHHSVSMVDQEMFFFEGSIRDNLTLWDKTVPDAQMVRAAKDAQIHHDISSRPRGYDGPVTEGGTNFSGGQRQRLEIARALLSNPTLLVLDEATSALDSLTEQRVDDSIRRRGCGCLIVAHRLSTIRDCDQILVLDRGLVVQRGTHDEMIVADGPYADSIEAGS